MMHAHSVRLAKTYVTATYFNSFSRICSHYGIAKTQSRPLSSGANTAKKNPNYSTMCDKVHIENLRINAVIGPDSWNLREPQECFITMNMQTDFSKAAADDDLRYTLNYAVISKEVTNFVNSKSNWNSLGYLSKSISDYALNKYCGIDKLQLKVETKTGHIRSDAISCVVEQERDSITSVENDSSDLICISNLKLLTLIGVFNFERLQKQYVTLDILIPWPKAASDNVPYKSIIDDVVKYVENSTFLTVEALVESTAKVITSRAYFKRYKNVPIEVKVIKLNAITSTSGVGVSSIKSFAQTELLNLPVEVEGKDKSSSQNVSDPLSRNETSNSSNNWNTAFLAFGSNVGNTFHNVKLALNLLRAHADVKVQKISSLFESEPMYFKDQDVFLNGCMQITTKLSPYDLLKLCKDIEYEELGRIKHFDNCPRVIDLDIIMFLDGSGEQMLLNTKDLIIPHPRLLERSFVLEPLCELIPPDFAHPLTAEPLFDHLSAIYDKKNAEDILWKVIPLPSCGSAQKFLKFKTVKMTDSLTNSSKYITESPSLLMGILNATPDSFSDGNQNFLDLEKQLQAAKSLCSEALFLQKQFIIDIGGCSTRPGALQVSEEEEINRVIPLIKALRGCNDLPQEKLIISIDTYRSKVAEEAIAAGVDVVNDISGGSFDARMFDVIAAHPNVAYILSHTRGDISNMTKLNLYEDSNNNTKEYLDGKEFSSKSTTLIRSIGRELSERYAEAILRGISRWQIIVDPGLGFAKNGMQNLEIIKQIPFLKNYSCRLEHGEFVSLKNIPVLVGPSRKEFIGKITKEGDPKNRDFATGSILTACIGFGADILRVHNVRDCSKAVRIADALYKNL